MAFYPWRRWRAERSIPAVIGGLTVATVATLFFVPTVISVLCRPHKGKVPYKVRHL
jgi:hypothetical protein